MVKGESDSTKSVQSIAWTYNPGPKTEGFPWGPHKLPFDISFEGVSLAVNHSGSQMLYRREGLGQSVEKMLITDRGRIMLSPVEPFHKPVGVSTHLLVDLEQPVVLQPRASTVILTTFPIDLACVIKHKQAGERILEIFSLNRPKFTLYGSVRSGLVCRYWRSSLYDTFPDVNPLRQGVMQITVQNPGNRWVELKKAVFSAQGMKIYYGPHLVSLKAVIKIINDLTAETNFLDEPLKKGMLKAVEQFSARMIGLPAKIVMEEGY